MGPNTHKSLVTFNTEQNLAKELISDFIHPTNKNNVFVLTGPPGSGKTFLLNYALSSYKGVLYGATLSHAAKNVLMSSTSDLDMRYYSIAQLVGATKQIEGESVMFVPKIGTRAPIANCDLLVVDEVSMLDDTTFDTIMRYSEQIGFKIIFVGDPYQLPPVGQETDSKAFDMVNCSLVESMRFKGPIGSMADEIRTEIFNLTHGLPFQRDMFDTIYRRKDNMSNGTGYKFENDSEVFLQYMADQIKSNPKVINHARILAYKNETIDIINNRMRSYIYGTNLKQFEPNENLICEGGYSIKVKREDGREIITPVLYNGQMLKFVNSYETIGPYEVPCLVMSLDSDMGRIRTSVPIYVVDRDKGLTKYNEVLRKLYNNATAYNTPMLWKKYHEFKESFATLRYAYCASTHKAQGLTLDTVGVMEGEIMSIQKLSLKHKLQSLYVALTRPKNELIIFNKHA